MIYRFRGRRRLDASSWLEDNGQQVVSNLSLTAGRAAEVTEVTCEVSSEAFVQLFRASVHITARQRLTTQPPTKAPTPTTTVLTPTPTTATAPPVTTKEPSQKPTPAQTSTVAPSTTSTQTSTATSRPLAGFPGGSPQHLPAEEEEEEVVIINLLSGDASSPLHLAREEKKAESNEQWMDKLLRSQGRLASQQLEHRQQQQQQEHRQQQQQQQQQQQHRQQHQQTGGLDIQGGPEYDYSHFDYVNQMMNESIASHDYSEEVIS
jgi:hypothetical protein